MTGSAAARDERRLGPERHLRLARRACELRGGRLRGVQRVRACDAHLRLVGAAELLGDEAVVEADLGEEPRVLGARLGLAEIGARGVELAREQARVAAFGEGARVSREGRERGVEGSDRRREREGDAERGTLQSRRRERERGREESGSVRARHRTGRLSFGGERRKQNCVVGGALVAAGSAPRRDAL